jgi:hypothetical protein
MSLCQYYEFRAVDRPLSRTEQDELRKISTRARITATGFVNHSPSAGGASNPTPHEATSGRTIDGCRLD